MTFVEIDAATADLCRENVGTNGFADRARAVRADVMTAKTRRAGGLMDGAYDLILTNPPFHEPGGVRVSPDADKARAHVAEGGLEAWMKASLALLAPGGLFLMIHRADALPAILAAAEGRIGALRLLPVLPRESEPAIRLLVAGRKGSRAPVAILPPLVLHGEDRRLHAARGGAASGRGRNRVLIRSAAAAGPGTATAGARPADSSSSATAEADEAENGDCTYQPKLMTGG